MRNCGFEVAIASLAFTLTLSAQSTLGTISGVVTDASGAVVPGTRLELIDEGLYQFLNLHRHQPRATIF